MRSDVHARCGGVMWDVEPEAICKTPSGIYRSDKSSTSGLHRRKCEGNASPKRGPIDRGIQVPNSFLRFQNSDSFDFQPPGRLKGVPSPLEGVPSRLVAFLTSFPFCFRPLQVKKICLVTEVRPYFLVLFPFTVLLSDAFSFPNGT